MQKFNLVTDPWLKVKFKSDQIKTISLQDLFKNISQIQFLAGESSAQNLAIFRLLEAIITTVYQHVNAQGQPYAWLNYLNNDFFDIDQAKEDLSDTWHNLKQTKNFDQVLSYLNHHQQEFNFIDDEKPFMQVNEDIFNAFAQKKIGDKAKITPISTINRSVNQSGNSLVTYSIISEINKNSISLPELVRWIITYQQYAGTSDKNVINNIGKLKDKGYLYSLCPIFIQGNYLFNTLLLNLVLFDTTSDSLAMPKPIWEQNNTTYLKQRINNIVPNNLPELYTQPSRMICIKWQNDQPEIYMAKLPAIDTANLFLEPMTTWRYNKKNNNFIPNAQSKYNIGKDMWQNFGEYFNPNIGTLHQPGIINWLQTLQENNLLPLDFPINLHLITIISDGSASNMLMYDINQHLQINADVVFGKKGLLWRTHIENVIDQTQQAATRLFVFGQQIAEKRQSQTKIIGPELEKQFYQELNNPFTQWLDNLHEHDDINSQIAIWQKQCYQLAQNVINQFMQTITRRDMTPDKNGKTIFNYRSLALYKTKEALNLNDEN